MREFLAIVTTFCIGLFITVVLAYSLERRQLASNPVDLDADVRPGIIAVSASGYAIPEKPLPAQAAVTQVATRSEPDRPSAQLVSSVQPR